MKKNQPVNEQLPPTRQNQYSQKNVEVWTDSNGKMILIFAIPRAMVIEGIRRSKRRMLDFEMEFTRMEAFDLLRAIACQPAFCQIACADSQVLRGF